jgi:cobalamin biosynthesis protein CobD/CbiB
MGKAKLFAHIGVIVMANKMPNWIINLIVAVLGPLIGLISPMLKGEIETAIRKLYDKAKESDSPVDDIFIRFLAGLLGVNLE